MASNREIEILFKRLRLYGQLRRRADQAKISTFLRSTLASH